MEIRFQADADLNQIIVLATIRREPSLDFVTSDAADLTGRKDSEVLAIAAKEGRDLSLMTRKPCHGTSLTSSCIPPARAC